MKKIIGYFTLFVALFASNVYAQDVSINISTFEPSIPLNTSTYVLVTLCNEDPSPIDAPANKLRPQLSIGPNATITGVTNEDGSPLTGFTVLSLSQGNANTVRILDNTGLANGECVSFRVIVMGTVVSSNVVFNGSLGFNGPQTPGNNTSNDNSPSGLAVTAPLPVNLVSFNASKENKTALLQWATTMETNSDHFEIQHSTTGKDWAKAGIVASHGESVTQKDYTFTHLAPVNGENLYRLKMVDKDATFAYSRIQGVKFEGVDAADLSVYPNPVSDKIFLRDFAEITKVEIRDLTGRSVYQGKANATGEVSVKNLSAGMYIVNITRVNGVKSTQKIVVSK